MQTESLSVSRVVVLSDVSTANTDVLVDDILSMSPPAGVDMDEARENLKTISRGALLDIHSKLQHALLRENPIIVLEGIASWPKRLLN